MKIAPAVLLLTAQRMNTASENDVTYMRALTELLCAATTPAVLKEWADDYAKRKGPA